MIAAQASLAALLAETRRRFAEIGISDPATDARTLIGGILGLSLTELMVRGAEQLSPQEAERVASAVARRMAREPVHRILGRRSFYGLEFELSPETLEPRPDTEILVDSLLPHLENIVARNGAARVLDLGTGSGAILVALLKSCPLATGVATDISAGALEIAARNAHINGVGAQFEALFSEWFAAVFGQFDVIVSNPPYIRSDAIAGLESDVREHDPARALDGGHDGLDAYRAISGGAAGFLEPNGIVGVEIGYDQKGEVSAIFDAAGFSLIEALGDYGGNDRVLLFKRYVSV